MNAFDRFAQLWTDYLEGELDEQGLAELRQLMAEDPQRVTLAADMFQTHRLLALAVDESKSRQDQFVREAMSRLPDNQDAFVRRVMSNMEPDASTPATLPKGNAFRTKAAAFGIAAAIMLAAVAAFYFGNPTQPQIAHDTTPQPIGGATAAADVRLASNSNAKFFGELSPPVGAVLAGERDYVLMSGMIEVAFPAGASAILEGPAVFRVMSDECLALDVGSCSVHAPDGAEGFRVETPATRVVDRGTRFSVNVSETSETEVQVIEGAADIYDIGGEDEPMPDRDPTIRMTDGDAQKFSRGQAFAGRAIPFDASRYRSRLPDRIIAYETTTAAEDGGAENLTGVTLQRGGRVVTVPVEDLIPIRVASFKATEPGPLFVSTGQTLPDGRIVTSSDRSLVTGAINPGGSREPLTSDPVLSGPSATPGMAIKFASPVENGPGPDVVFFDLQTFSNPPDGDAFHVSPLRFREGLRSHSIRVYDLTMESPNARDLTAFYIHQFAQPVDSIADLQTQECFPNGKVLKFRGLAVGIDLSDLGYADGQRVDGLFIQDAMDDRHHVDPVFIGGLPAMAAASGETP
ncbi:FecR protein [Rosistilla oblonga]|uniref:FecR domain-containing protein n=1 Tax=Rosistilla oblonga TaxID=2527990 RepID=UPI00118AC9CB|nr:FecR domain-containing protein [Rosistilla oblonga]QDV14499.1 FecR protein [Rosistilla oblonga]